MTFYCIKRIKGRPYLYRQTSYRHGKKVVSDSVYIGPAAGAIPYGFAPKTIEPPQHRKKVLEKINRSLSITAERLARETARQIHQDKKARRLRSIRFELGALRHLERDPHLWRKLYASASL